MLIIRFDGIDAKVESIPGVETNMTKSSHGIAMDGLTPANMQKAIGRVPPAQATMQRGLTAANLQTGLTAQPAPRPPTTSTGTAGTSTSSGSK